MQVGSLADPVYTFGSGIAQSAPSKKWNLLLTCRLPLLGTCFSIMSDVRCAAPHGPLPASLHGCRLADIAAVAARYASRLSNPQALPFASCGTPADISHFDTLLPFEKAPSPAQAIAHNLRAALPAPQLEFDASVTRLRPLDSEGTSQVPSANCTEVQRQFDQIRRRGQRAGGGRGSGSSRRGMWVLDAERQARVELVRARAKAARFSLRNAPPRPWEEMGIGARRGLGGDGGRWWAGQGLSRGRSLPAKTRRMPAVRFLFHSLQLTWQALLMQRGPLSAPAALHQAAPVLALAGGESHHPCISQRSPSLPQTAATCLQVLLGPNTANQLAPRTAAAASSNTTARLLTGLFPWRLGFTIRAPCPSPGGVADPPRTLNSNPPTSSSTRLPILERDRDLLACPEWPAAECGASAVELVKPHMYPAEAAFAEVLWRCGPGGIAHMHASVASEMEVCVDRLVWEVDCAFMAMKGDVDLTPVGSLRSSVAEDVPWLESMPSGGAAGCHGGISGQTQLRADQTLQEH
jgi:hypothetical protein